MKRLVWFSATLIILLFVSSPSNGDGISSKEKEQINSNINLANTLASTLKDHKKSLIDNGKSVSPLLKYAGKMAPFLGAAGAFVGVLLVFLPRADSPELAYMKTQFRIVNNKLDEISEKLSDIETLITYEAQRATYIEMENTIKFGYKQVNSFYDEIEKLDCSNDCQKQRLKVAKRYLADFKKVESALYQIMKGSIEKSVFKDPLLELVQKKYKCDVGKLTEFTESIINMAEKAQQVILTHQKLAGTDVSIVSSLKSWLALVYDLRRGYYDVKNACFTNMKSTSAGTYLAEEIADLKYQNNYGNNDDAIKALKSNLEAKYTWLKWSVWAYNKLSGFSKHAFYWKDGKINMPGGDNRKRVIFALPFDPKGRYSASRQQKVINVISKQDSRHMVGCIFDKRKCLEPLKDALVANDLWRDVQVLNVMVESTSPTIPSSINRFSYINKVVVMKEMFTYKVRVIIMLRSEDQVESTTKCTTTCYSRGGICKRLPFSKISECQCKDHFDGDQCRDHSENGLASTLDLLVSETLKVPTLVDIYFDIKDLQENINLGFSQIDKAFGELASMLQASYAKLSAQLGQNFQWTDLKISYVDTIKDILHFIEEFKTRSSDDNNDKRGKELAEYILQPGNIKRWLGDLNTLFVGSSVIVEYHLPLLIVYMNAHKGDACTTEYKNHIDNKYRQFVVLQQEAYLMWAEALNILEEEPTEAADEYSKILKEQEKKYNEMACRYDNPNSIRSNCNGRYIHPDISITTTCKPNYYLKGPAVAKCKDATRSQCIPCSCNSAGSLSAECSDQTGKCACRVTTKRHGGKVYSSSYYGDKCTNLNCVWSSWGSYSSCSRTCNYGGKKWRYRQAAIAKKGSGKSCTGVKARSTSCFNKCCNDDFNCYKVKRCIRSYGKCNYSNSCGATKEDEDDKLCQEKCFIKYSSKQNDGGGKIVYMDRQSAICGDKHALQMFRLVRVSGGYIRYQMKCCILNGKYRVTSRKRLTTKPTLAKNVIYLDRQTVYCPTGSFMDGFGIDRHGSGTVYLYYYLYCNTWSSVIGRRQKCKTGYTGWNTIDGKNYYLDRHMADCSRIGSRYFMRGFKLERNGSKMRYRFECCRIFA